MPGASIEQHVELIARHEQDFLNQRSRSERIGDVIAGFAGSLKFVGLHLGIFTVWIALNVWPGRKHLRALTSLWAATVTAALASSCSVESRVGC